MTRTFNFPSNPNYGVVHDDYQKNNADSLFRDVYTKAFLKVCEIVKSGDSSHNIDEIINTCIAFVGGRGSGKSSSMATVADCLDSLNISDDEAKRFAKHFQGNDGEIVCSKRYYVLKSVEVSHMTTNTTVLGNISAQMHDKVMEKKMSLWKKSGNFLKLPDWSTDTLSCPRAGTGRMKTMITLLEIYRRLSICANTSIG